MRTLLIAISFLLCSLSACAVGILPPDFRPYNLVKSVSIPYAARFARCIAVDGQHIVWAGTHRGLVRYDGAGTVWYLTGGTAAEREILTILPYGHDHLLIGTRAGLVLFNTLTGLPDALPAPLTRLGGVKSMALWRGSLWIGLADGGVWQYGLRSKRLASVGGSRVWAHNIYALCPVGNRLYVGSLAGLFSYDTATARIARIKPPTTDRFVSSLFWYASTGELFVGMEHDLFAYSPATGAMSRVDALHGNMCKTIAADRSGNIIVGTDNGLRFYNLHTRRAHTLRLGQTGEPVNASVVWQVCADSRGNVWMAAQDGIAELARGQGFFYYDTSAFSADSNPSLYSMAIEDRRGRLWIGGESGLVVADSLGGKSHVVRYSVESTAHPLRHNRIKKIYEDRDGDVWIASDGGIARLNEATRQFDYFTVTNRRGETSKWAYDLFEDSRHRLWITTYSAGLFIVDKQRLLSARGRTLADNGQPDRMESLKGDKMVQRIIPGDGDDVYLCTNDGVVRKNAVTGRETRTVLPNSNAVFCNHALYLSADDGSIVRFDGRQPATVMRVRGGVSSLFRVGLYVWFTCADGVFSIDTCTQKTYYCGRPQAYCLGGTFLPRRSEVALFGENFMALCRARHSDYRPSLRITSLRDMPDDSIRLVPPAMRELRVSRGAYVTMYVSTSDYNLQGEGTFYYQFGDRDRWRMSKPATNELSFAHMSAGKYTLRLSATNPDIDRNAVVTAYDIVVPRPWYLSDVALILYVLLVLFAIIGFLLWSYRRSRAMMRRREKEQVLELLRQKNDFLINMSHELKTPLSLIIAPLTRLVGTAQNPAVKRSLNGILKNAMKLNVLIHRVLEAKGDDFREDDTLYKSQVELCELVSMVVAGFAVPAEERGVSLNVEAGPENIWLSLDVMKMQSVVANLVQNAMNFVSDLTGKVTVRVSADAGQASIVVEDNGKGIPERDIKMIFTRYYQGGNQRSANKGSGIGLYLVKKYVELHGGTVSVSSGDVTRFTVSLPMVEQEASPQPSTKGEGESSPADLQGRPSWPSDIAEGQETVACPASQQHNPQLREGTRPSPATGRELSPGASRPTLLIVDDNREIVSVLAEALGERYNCLSAFDGASALDIVTKTVPDLVVVDQMMPGMSGFQLVRALKHSRETSSLPIIMLTAKDDRPTKLESIRLGIDVFFPKPFDIHEFELQVERLLHSRYQTEKAAIVDAMSNPQFAADKKGNDPDVRLMGEITRLIEQNIGDDSFNVTSLAQKLGYPQKQLYRKLKELTGLTPVAYIRKIRLKKAAFLLRTGNYSATEVMYMVGFNNMSYFIKCFTAEYQLTPRQFMDKEKTEGLHQAPSKGEEC